MKYIAAVAFVALASAPVHAAKPCEELKSEITTKMDAAGVQNYVLEIVDTDKVADAKVVGSCDGGTKKITYERSKKN